MKFEIKLIFLFSLSLFLLSCGSDSKQVEVEKAEWVTRFEDYSIDTVASYSLVSDYINFEESYSAVMQNVCQLYNNQSKSINGLYNKIKNINNSNRNDYDELKNSLENLNNSTSQKNPSGSNRLTREITIRNNSDFPANFAIGDTINFYQEGINSYCIIQPRDSATFRLSKSINWNSSNNSNFKSEITILQKQQKITLTRRIDELLLSTITINTRQQSEQALKREYKTVKDLYYNKVNAEGKQIIQIVKKIDDKKTNVETKMEISVKKKPMIEIEKERK